MTTPIQAQAPGKVSRDVWFLLWVAWVAIAAPQILTYGYGMMVPHIIADFGVDYAVIGSIGSAAAWVAVVANIPITLVASKTNPKYSLPVIYIVYAIGGLMFASATSISMLYVGRMVLGAGQTGLITCLVVVKIRRVPAEKILDVNALENFVQPIGQTCGTMFGAQLIALLSGWRNVYRVISVLMIACAVLYIIAYQIMDKNDPAAPPSKPKETEASTEAVKEKSPLLQALSHKTVILYGLAYPGTIIIWIGFFYFFPSYFMQVRGFSAEQAGMATGLFPIMSALSSITFPKVAKKYDLNKIVLLGSGVALAVLYFIILQIKSFPLLCLVSAFTGYVSYTPVPLLFSNVYRLGLPPRAVQMATSILLTMVSVGSAIGSGAIGSLVNTYGLYLGLAVCCATPLWYALLCLFTPDYSAKAMAKRAQKTQSLG